MELGANENKEILREVNGKNLIDMQLKHIL